jgi:hypothetical protein
MMPKNRFLLANTCLATMLLLSFSVVSVVAVQSTDEVERDEAWLAYERSIKRYLAIMNESTNRD